jgi:hypothetical protein
MDVRVTCLIWIRVIIESTSVNYEYRTRNENYSVESIERCDNILIYS